MESMDSIETLVHVIRELAADGFSPATGGNFSMREGLDQFCITASGCDKRRVSVGQFIRLPVAGALATTDPLPSAETALHQRLYRLDPTIGCVLHTHSVAATVLSRLDPNDTLVLRGYEMQKAIRGQTTHEATLALPLFDNTQDIPALADQLAVRWEAEGGLPGGFLVRGHGLYAWGRTVAEARRHVEGWEFLLNCLLQERLLEARQ
ncbi:methylthioribulose 1-phosphate dehydratase [Candidatus Macondimonas diazotrophica]|jgi:methylthioribulose-1-phosphate dehydratase|uniref:Methylthioribulose-1-phosphate dehydratase n=1 Tax=Candidatus Macondimonas diazotrophica TaxID=2305248 RepID=A0A4Z0F7M6_9GAMM|nr:methylthioribulose 1-phosphate dehydratase [Candidatus Macondimonas diazotrophica]NCU01191.1 methylthioribulose 1-phosphate dehydratase [Candidatus Macondimonas diazotrophica]TFZ82311.1 methylthioribulose 1-phosphate dehydratase [Candidatus Macondimonas diazotrophica]HBG51461.1 methylthioribulose 1-phosphate dehydratase [Gammaproteobacteria bacterium]